MCQERAVNTQQRLATSAELPVIKVFPTQIEVRLCDRFSQKLTGWVWAQCTLCIDNGHCLNIAMAISHSQIY